MAKGSYKEKYLDPRWQKMRLQIMERDGFACTVCGETKLTLNVHHEEYWPGRDPWEYHPNILLTLCVRCHERATIENPNPYELRHQAEQTLLDELRNKGFTSEDVLNLLTFILNLPFPCDFFADSIGIGGTNGR